MDNKKTGNVMAFLQNRKKTFEEKIHLCAMGIGDDNIVIMLFIYR